LISGNTEELFRNALLPVTGPLVHSVHFKTICLVLLGFFHRQKRGFAEFSNGLAADAGSSKFRLLTPAGDIRDDERQGDEK
jgi:hypothetical protein